MANSYMISLFFLLTCFSVTYAVPRPENPPAVFIFGDSSADVGTNSYIKDCGNTANYEPNGIDKFPNNPTGRYSNGFITVDYLCAKMGFEKSPEPFLSYPNGVIFPSDNFTGLNFASAGSGFLEKTGRDGKSMPVPKQIEQFNIVRDNLTDIMGHSEADEFFAKSIFIISAGTNDMFDYIMGDKKDYDITYFCAQTVFTEYQNAIKSLYNLGARKFGIISALPVGCTPLRRPASDTKVDCVEKDNKLSRLFYRHLGTMLEAFSYGQEDFIYSLANTHALMMYEIDFTGRDRGMVVDSACCGSGPLRGQFTCGKDNYKLCRNRDNYVFWDGVHPTDIASHHAATMFFDGYEYTKPINFKDLVDEPELLSS